MQVSLAICGVVLSASIVPILLAQDAVKADPKHYTVLSENAQVRILKAHYGPHEKSVMHSHPATVAVFLTDAKAQFTFPDGKKEAYNPKAGEARYSASATHLPENLGDHEMDVIVVELKGRTARPMKMEKMEKMEKK